jgi:hypothetical protein
MVREITMNEFEQIMNAANGNYLCTTFFGSIVESKTYRGFDFLSGSNGTYLFRDILDDDFEFNIEKIKIITIVHDYEKDEEENQISLLFRNGDSLIINFYMNDMNKLINKDKKKDRVLVCAAGQYSLN